MAPNLKTKDDPADIPQSAKDAVRSRFLKSRNKRISTRKIEKKQVTKTVTHPAAQKSKRVKPKVHK